MNTILELLPVLALIILLGVVALWLARRKDTAKRAEHDVPEGVFDVDRTGLENLRRVNDVFFAAREDLRQAAWEHS